MKAVKEVWVRSAQAMGADDRRLFHKVILPGALPYILTGLRLGLAQAWRILVGVEMLAAVPWGLGWMIFGAREFLNTDVMLAGVVVIGAIGLTLEKLVFQRLEDYHGRALGDDDVSAYSDRTRSMRRAAFSLVLAAAVYEGIARSGHFPAALLPTLPAVGRALVEGCLDGTLPGHAASTLVPRSRRHGPCRGRGPPARHPDGPLPPVEGFFLPLASALMPIPSLAWVPVFILWFGLGNATAIGIVFYAALFPMLLNAWSGVRAVNPLWLRAGSAMGAGERSLFWKVIIPGASPFIITGLRQAFLRAWIAVVGAEMLAASDWGLGWVIFDAKEFLKADVMLASLAVIGLIGFVFERLVFGSLERATVQRWGMVRTAKG